jgi:hypothetical protein
MEEAERIARDEHHSVKCASALRRLSQTDVLTPRAQTGGHLGRRRATILRQARLPPRGALHGQAPRSAGAEAGQPVCLSGALPSVPIRNVHSRTAHKELALHLWHDPTDEDVPTPLTPNSLRCTVSPVDGDRPSRLCHAPRRAMRPAPERSVPRAKKTFLSGARRISGWKIHSWAARGREHAT